MQELWARILAAPDDDAPRLAYAAAVGGGLGELIAVQCALARLARRDPERAALAAREAQLFDEHGGAIAWPGVGERAVGVVRGFVEHVVIDAQAFVDGGLALERTLVRSVKLERVSGRLEEVLACPWMARLEVLHLGGAFLTNLDAERLATCAALRRLRGLELSRNDLDDRGVERIAASGVLLLSRLGLGGNIVGDDGIAAIADGAACVGLRDLSLAREVVSAAGFGTIVRPRALARLRRLPLSRLVLRGNPLDEEAAFVLAEGFEELRELDLSECRLPPSAVRALAAAPGLSRDLLLRVREAGIDSDGIEALRARFAEVVS